MVKKTHPDLQIMGWIKVGNYDCVVKKILPQDYPGGVCIVVFNKTKPTTHHVGWDGEKWFFPERPDFGGYARESDPCVAKLKRGR